MEPPIGGLEMLEVVTGIVFGLDATIPLPPRGLGDPRGAMERGLVGSLEKTPCGVAFSGGRDSSAVLAMATSVARQHHLPDPIPVTLRFPAVGDADETSYQESVVRRLGLSEWARVHPTDSLDILGDLSSRLTQRHGLLYPGNIHFLVPMLDIVRGGALLTGLGGDEVLEGHGNHALAAMMTAQQRPSRRTVRSLAKRYVLRGRQRDQSREAMDGYFSWLVPQARRLVIERMVESLMSDSLWADRQLTTITYRMRYLHRARTDLSRVAAEFGVDVTHPLLGAEFVGAVADRYGRVGFSSRTESMEQLFGDLLPDDVIRRTSKAVFDEVFWTDTAAERVRELSLSPVAEYVDGEALRRHWRSDAPKGNTFLLAKYLADVATPTDGSDAQSSADDRRG